MKFLVYILIGSIISGIFSEITGEDEISALVIVSLFYPIILLLLLAYIVFNIFFGIGVCISIVFKKLFENIKEKYKECTAQKK